MIGLKPNRIFKYFLTISFLAIFFGCVLFSDVAGGPRFKNVGGNSTSDNILANEGWVIYNFPHGNSFELQSNVNVSLQLSINPQIISRNLKFNITSSSPVNLTIMNGLYEDYFEEGNLQRNQHRYRNRWGLVLHFQLNVSIDKLELFTEIGDANQVFQEDQWAIYSSDVDWTLLETASNQSEISTTLETISTDFYVSIFAPQQDYTMFFVLISILGVIVLSLTITLSKSEYRQYIKNRLLAEPQQKHRLNIEEVLENENRSNIIDTILENPGIHFNEILRATGLSPGNLVWHLDILESYKIIGKKNVGQYLVYFPYYDSNPLSKIDIKLAKSKVTLKILKLIEENPGNYANNFAKLLKLDHKTVKYHIEKLLEEGLVEIKQSGRKKLLYPVLENKESITRDLVDI